MSTDPADTAEAGAMTRPDPYTLHLVPQDSDEDAREYARGLRDAYEDRQADYAPRVTYLRPRLRLVGAEPHHHFTDNSGARPWTPDAA